MKNYNINYVPPGNSNFNKDSNEESTQYRWMTMLGLNYDSPKDTPFPEQDSLDNDAFLKFLNQCYDDGLDKPFGKKERSYAPYTPNPLTDKYTVVRTPSELARSCSTLLSKNFEEGQLGGCTYQYPSVDGKRGPSETYLLRTPNIRNVKKHEKNHQAITYLMNQIADELQRTGHTSDTDRLVIKYKNIIDAITEVMDGEDSGLPYKKGSLPMDITDYLNCAWRMLMRDLYGGK